MIETIKHFFGFCGEPHPSLIWLMSLGGMYFYIIKHNIKWCWNKGCDFCKSKIMKKEKVNP